MDTSESVVLNDWIIIHFHKCFFNSKISTAEKNLTHFLKLQYIQKTYTFSPNTLTTLKLSYANDLSPYERSTDSSM